MNGKKDATISKLKEKVISFERQLKRECTEAKGTDEARGKPEPRVVRTDGSGAIGTKSRAEVGTKTPAHAWQGAKPDWITVEKDQG